MSALDTRPPDAVIDVRPDPWWRAALVAGGVLMLAGGPMHPDSPAELPLRQELAFMMDDDAWVPSHAVLLVAVALFTFGLWRVRRVGEWPTRAAGALRVAVVAFALYTVEAFVHLIAFVDVDRLRDGDFAPVAFSHLALAAVLSPLSGIALACLAWRLLPTWSLPQRVFAVAGVVGGALHAAALPTTLILPDAEVSFMFAVGGISTAVWSIAAGLVGVRAAAAARHTSEAIAA